MSKRHQASRRRTYGRRQHDLRERRDRVLPDGTVERDLVEDGFAPLEGAIAEQRGLLFGATWLGLE
jgi:hypothetical protein